MPHESLQALHKSLRILANPHHLRERVIVANCVWSLNTICFLCCGFLQGLRLELCTSDRVGLLSDVTQIFRENGLSVTRADVSTQGDKAMDVFYVTDASGNPVDKTVETIKRNYPILGVKDASPSSISSSPESSSSSNEQATSPLSSFLKTSESFFQGITTGWKMSTVA